MSCPESRLASALILQCLYDVQEFHVPNHYDILFLQGIPSNAQHWFDLAGVQPLSQKQILTICPSSIIYFESPLNVDFSEVPF